MIVLYFALRCSETRFLDLVVPLGLSRHMYLSFTVNTVKVFLRKLLSIYF